MYILLLVLEVEEVVEVLQLGAVVGILEYFLLQVLVYQLLHIIYRVRLGVMEEVLNLMVEQVVQHFMMMEQYLLVVQVVQVEAHGVVEEVAVEEEDITVQVEQEVMVEQVQSSMVLMV
jgi:hypothetical protein